MLEKGGGGRVQRLCQEVLQSVEEERHVTHVMTGSMVSRTGRGWRRNCLLERITAMCRMAVLRLTVDRI